MTPKQDKQVTISGAEQISSKEHAQRLADRKLTPKVVQREVGGLFGDQSKQIDLVDLTRQGARNDT